ncbi:MAG: aromatic ring-opening dioxygenase LigA [Cellulomonas sp.]
MSNVTVTDRFKGARIIALLTIIAGVVLIVAGGITWGAVASQLKAEKIEVAAVTPENPGALAGKTVQDPFTAYAQANAVNEHSLEATKGRTFAQLGDDINAKKAALKAAGTSDADIAKDKDVLALGGQRTTIQTGSFLRASLFTSVVAFGIAALVMGLGVLFILVGYAVRILAVKSETVVAPVAVATQV